VAVFDVTRDVLDPQPLLDFVRKDESGAVVVFHGVVRGRSEGRRVLYLEYDAYVPMAVKEMQRIGEELRARWQVTAVAMRHRIGRLEVGETCLVVAVSAPHRKDAFAACHYAIDRLKETVPIWKKEVWEGGEAWVEGHVVKGESVSSSPD
jgi:molybdopterin synthase catalytic subunit